MRIDHTHRTWAVGTVAATILASAVYAWYAATAPDGPRGGSWPGLIFGTAAAALVLFAGGLAARKKVLLARVGSVAWWMRGHLWLGLLSLPLALLHAAFAFGGLLSTVLLTLLVVVVVSGILGAWLQHAMPTAMTAELHEEHTGDQLDRWRNHLRKEAYELVAVACGPLEAMTDEKLLLTQSLGHPPKEPKKATAGESAEPLAQVYLSTVLPFLRNGAPKRSPLANGATATMLFEDLRPRLHPDLHGAVDELAAICDSARQMTRQRRLHLWLHAWLLVHVPLSMALIVLMFVHAVAALYY